MWRDHLGQKAGICAVSSMGRLCSNHCIETEMAPATNLRQLSRLLKLNFSLSIQRWGGGFANH